MLSDLYLKSGSHVPIKLCYIFHLKPFKKDEKCFLFYLKSSFRSQYFQVFVMSFRSCWKNGLITKIRLTSIFTRHNLVSKQLQYTFSNIS